MFTNAGLEVQWIAAEHPDHGALPRSLPIHRWVASLNLPLCLGTGSSPCAPAGARGWELRADQSSRQYHIMNPYLTGSPHDYGTGNDYKLL